MTARDIRNSFLKFFEDRGHRIVESASVIPYDDPTLLFTNAGMNQFKDVFLGTGKRDYVRAADSQKCIRVSGKHNDLEEVGRDTYHHTFFEMLGNWSFGDYYKEEAIAWAWELLTGIWGMEKSRLYVTVYESDEEAFDLWKKTTDIGQSHILRFGKKDNFWEMGETGPCGPCSEIHIDLTTDQSGAKLVNAGDPRVMEIWNLVFIQYDRGLDGNLTPLPSKHVDTGMGFERICAVLQGKKSNYDTDVFLPVIRRIGEISGKPYSGRYISLSELPNDSSGEQRLQFETDVAMRVIADHVRMLSFSVADGALPSNEGRGYVMRRILRRAARFGRNLGMREPFIFKVVGSLIETMGNQYPEIGQRQQQIERVIRSEEESFSSALERGMEIFETVIQEIGHSRTFPGEDAFKLYDTYGFPLDLTEQMAQERGLGVDTSRFLELMEEQRTRARSARSIEAASGGADFQTDAKTYFVGYDHDEYESRVTDILSGEGDDKLQRIVLAETPFYTESGGQISDTGELFFPQINAKSHLTGIFKTPGGAVVHVLGGIAGLEAGMKVRAIIDKVRRRNTERNHTATHIVHEALRRVLGTHLQQQGSLVAPERLRFDFNHFEKISPERIREIEDIVNEKIAEDIQVETSNDPKDWLTMDQAREKYPNVKMFFGDKYGDRVRIVEIDPKYSVELCGGTHTRRTGEIGLFKIISESSVASGIRRIEAVTGDGLERYIAQEAQKAAELDGRIEKLTVEAEDLRRQLGTLGQDSHRVQPERAPLLAGAGKISPEDLSRIELALRQRQEAYELLSKTVHDLRKEESRQRVRDATSGIGEIASSGVVVEGIKVVWGSVKAQNMDELKSLGDSLRTQISSGVGVLGAAINGKASLVCVVTDDLIKTKKLSAGKIVGEIARLVGGGGGGRPHLATAGGKDVHKLDEALREAPAIVKSLISG